MLLLALGTFIVSTYLLVRSADWFVEAVERIGIALKMPHFLTGVLIVAIGTSLPELATGIASVLRHESDMLVGNILGSGIANIFLGLGFVSFLARKNIKFQQNIFQVHFPMFVMAVTVLVMTVIGDRTITWSEGICFLGILVGYLWFLFCKDSGKPSFLEREQFRWDDVLLAVVSLAVLILSSDILISSVIFLGESLSIPNSVLAGTLVAVGTSLPEMMVVYAALKKGNAELAVGNILGSNIFNILLIIGAGSFVSLFAEPLTISDITFHVMLPFTIASVFIYWSSSKDREITRQEGFGMTIVYILFLAKLFGWF